MFGKVTGRGGAFHVANEASHLKGAEPQRSPICRVLLYLYLHPITQNDHARQGHLWGRGVFLWVSPTSHPKWTGTPVFSNCGGFLSICAYTLRRRMTKFDVIKLMGRGLFYDVSHKATHPSQGGRTPSVPNFGGFLFMAIPFDAELSHSAR